MASTTQNAEQVDKQEVYNYLSSPQFRTTDLHTHLHGMGNADFWVRDIMCGLLKSRGATKFSHIQYFGPPKEEHKEGKEGKKERKEFWKQFIKRDHWEPITFANYDKQAPLKDPEEVDYKALITACLEKAHCAEALKLPLSDSLIKAVLSGKVNPGKFLDSFTSDVVYELKSLCSALGVQESPDKSKKAQEDNSLHVAKFQIHSMLQHKSAKDSEFKEYIFFNARDQKFDYAWGITNKDLCTRMGYHKIDADLTAEEKSNRAQIRNCFSMLNLDGSRPSEADFRVRYCGHFTPEFYPRRFALKDCILSQELQASTELIFHVLKNYRKNHVVHVEFSLGQDLLNPWVYKYLVAKTICREINEFRLCSEPEFVQDRKPSVWTEEESRQFLQKHAKEWCDEWMKRQSKEKNLLKFFEETTKEYTENSNAKKIKVLLEELEGDVELQLPSYTFLLGLSRGRIRLPLNGELKKEPTPQEAQKFLLDRPLYATSMALVKEIFEDYKKYPEQITKHLNQSKANPHHAALHNRLVGLDYVGDEAGFPYCPFILDSFLDLAQQHDLAFRLHCGENVHKGNELNDPITEAFWAHMDISVFTIRRICERGIPLRIGHGVAFECAYACINKEWLEGDRHPEKGINTIREATPYHNIIKTCIIEVNLTSNIYLLSKVSELRAKEHQIAAHAVKNFDKMWILSTDDDGVWDLQNCTWHEHSSVSGEYCGAIEHSLIKDIPSLKQKQILSLQAPFRIGERFRKKDESLKITLEMTASPSAVTFVSCIESEVTNQSPSPLQLDDFWTCHPVLPRQKLALTLTFFNCFEDHPEVLEDEVIQDLLGLRTFFHCCGIYKPVGQQVSQEPFLRLRQFLSSINTKFEIPIENEEKEDDNDLSKYFLALLMPVTLTTEFREFLQCCQSQALLSHDRLKTLPVKQIKPEMLLDAFIGLARTLFMALDTCVLIKWNNTIDSTLESLAKNDQEVPFMLKEGLSEKRRNAVISHIDKIANEIINYIHSIRDKAEILQSSDDYTKWDQWFRTHVQHFNVLGRSELEYRAPGSSDTDKLIHANKLPTLTLKIPCPKDSPCWTVGAPLDFNTQNPQIKVQPITKHAVEKEPPITEDGTEEDVFVITQRKDNYVRPLPSFFNKEWIANGTSHELFQDSDKIPTDWFCDAWQIFYYLNARTKKNNLRLYGLACRGASVALLTGYILVTQGWPATVEVILFGGVSFGSSSFRHKIREAISKQGLRVVRLVSANYPEEEKSELLKDVETKTIDFTPFGAPIIIPSFLAPAQHYVHLFLQYTKVEPLSMERGEPFQIDPKSNSGLVKGLSLYEKCTMTIPGEAATVTKKELNERMRTFLIDGQKVLPIHVDFETRLHKDLEKNLKGMFPSAHQRVPEYLLCVSWKEVFQSQPIKATIRSVLDLLCAMRLLAPQVLVKLDDHHVTAVPTKNMNRCMHVIKDTLPEHVKPILKKFYWFDDAMRTEVDKYVLVLIDFAWVNSDEEAVKQMGTIKQQMSTSKPLPQNGSKTENVNNYLMLAALLRHATKNVNNPFLSKIGEIIDKCAATVNDTSEVTPVFTAICKELEKIIESSDSVAVVDHKEPKLLKLYQLLNFTSGRDIRHAIDYSRSVCILDPMNPDEWIHLVSLSLLGMFLVWTEKVSNPSDYKNIWTQHSNTFVYAMKRYCALPDPYPELRIACDVAFQIQEQLYSTDVVSYYVFAHFEATLTAFHEKHLAVTSSGTQTVEYKHLQFVFSNLNVIVVGCKTLLQLDPGDQTF